MADRYEDSDELTVPQERLVRDVASIAAEQHVTKALKRVWMGMIGIILTVCGWGFWLSFETGVHLNKQDNNYQQLQFQASEIQQLVNSRSLDESQAAATNATLIQMQSQLNRIEEFQTSKRP